MKLHTLPGLVTVMVIIAACSKNTFTTKPQLHLKSVSSDYVPKGGGLQFSFEFTDSEGDVSAPVGVQKISSSCDNAGFIDTVKFQFPGIPHQKNFKGILEINLPTNSLQLIRCFGVDSVETATFKFWIKDEAGNVSDTVTVPGITLEK